MKLANPAWRCSRPIGLLLLGAAIAGCGAATPPDSAETTGGPASAPASAPGSDAASASDALADGELVDIGGRSLYLECRGSGAPTILFLHGYGASSSHGSHLFEYADRHRVCLYDRANTGRSDSVEGVQTGADIVDDLTRLLETAEIPGPYLLVGASHGGVIAELFAGAEPAQIAGIVLVDGSLHSDADLDRHFAGLGEFDLEAFQAEFEADVERTAWSVYDEAAAAVETIPDVPITYLAAIFGVQESPTEADALWDAGLAELLARSSNGQRIDVEGPHDLPPEPIHAAIDEMLTLLGGT